MRPQLKAVLKLAAVVLLVSLVVLWAIARASSLGRTGEENARVWFYDQSEKRLYAASPDVLPPDKGIGGKKGDGVRAIVVTFRSSKDDPSHRIAYLQTYAPELKTLLDRVQTARRTGRPLDGRIPSRDSDFFQTNTLVCRLDEPTWHPSNSPEGQRITAEWRSWRGPAGQAPVVIAP